MRKLIGYARVSTNSQNLRPQLDALIKAGCKKTKIFIDTASGAKSNRPGLEECLKKLQKGDTLLVWRLDRLGRSLVHLVNLIQELRKRGIRFKSICDGAIDTTTASGELFFNIFSSLAQFERTLIQERTRAGLSAARARGKIGGRKPVSPNDPRVVRAKKMHKEKRIKVETICKILEISRDTFYRWVRLY